MEMSRITDQRLKACPFCRGDASTKNQNLTWCTNPNCEFRAIGITPGAWNERPGDAVIEQAQKVADDYRELGLVRGKNIKALSVLLPPKEPKCQK